MTPKNKQKQTKRFVLTPSATKRVLLVLLAALLTVIIIPKGGFVPDYYQPGDIASRDIKTPRDFLVPEPELTEKKKQDAADAVIPLYDYDPRPSKAVALKFSDVLGQLNAEKHRLDTVVVAPTEPTDEGKSASDTTAKAIVEAGVMPLPPVDPAAILDLQLSPAQVEALRRLAEDDALVAQFSRDVRAGLNRKIVGNLELFQNNWHGSILVRDLAHEKEAAIEDKESVRGINEVINDLRQQLFGDQAISEDAAAVMAVLQKMVRPNLTFNQSETEARKRAAAESVLPVLLQVKRGEMIVREGERVTAEQVRKLHALQSSVDGFKMARNAAGLMLAILLLFYVVHRFAKMNIRKYHPEQRDLLFLVSVFVGLFVIAKVGIFISMALQSAFPYIDSACYYYLLPFAAGAMLVRIVLNSEVAYVFSMLLALLMGMLFGNNLFISLYVLAGSVTAAHWVRHSQARSNLYRAGWYLALVNMGMVLAIYSLSDNPFNEQVLYRLGFAFVGAFGCAMVVNGTIPLVESLFKYTTDFKLMELANMNTPILRELMIQAPGTYHHSIVVGNLVENAAEAIGANPLLARVAAYYHDIGKIKKPLYFAENMHPPENRHDKLAPSMSALILISHVKDGVELAKEHKLGQDLIEIIRQHHGTALIKFFFDKAQQREKDGQVNEQDYRYPGPKPQTREAALIMLADSVEAAGRTLMDPTPARIQGMVQKIINKIFIDGQLDECELTLKDLHEIAKSFNRMLSGIFHQRVEYPEPAYKEREKDKEIKRINNDDLYRESAAEPRYNDSNIQKGSQDDLKRLGMS
nr:HDIG domain-containing metalloprotein [uncultured Desulfuromonas sp.]